MTAKAAIFVSKRLQRPVAAVLCLMMAQAAVTLPRHQPTVPGAVRVHITAAR